MVTEAATESTTAPKTHADAVAMRGLTRMFGEHRAVHNVDLSIPTGELFSLLGPNGAGKTTTIKMLSCLLRPTSGTATIMGHDIQTDAMAVKQVISISPQESALADHLNAWDNLSLMAGLHGFDKAKTRRISEEMLEMMGLIDRSKEQVRKFSGGMKRRLSIAMALVSEPQVLFLDEPTLGLDPQSRGAIWEHIATLKGKTTILHTTHYLEEADALADRIGVIDHGEIVALGTADELKAGISGVPVTVVEASNIPDDALTALHQLYPHVRRVEGGVEIEADDVSLYAIEDCLRPMGVVIDATYRRHVTLDDVFLELTGRQLRE